MRHLGDITKISGYDAPVVDCIIGGSPCQDLSVAGKRAGLDGERSGLYIEQVRIVKEMRKRDELNGRSGVDVRPRYMVWENVPGAFSSNKGEDFRIVLEEIAKVCDKDAVIPMPDKEKWTNHGCVVGDGWSVAWRVLDAQFWGVPQRRRRIALVADFGGQSAPEILFVRQSVSGHTDESLPKRKGTATDAQGSIGADDSEGEIPYTLKIRSGCEGGGKGALIQKDKSATLSTLQDQTLFQPVCSYNIGDRFSVPSELEEKSHTLTARCGTGGNNVPAIVSPVYSVESHPQDSRVGINEDGIVQTLPSRMGTGGGNVPMVMQQCYSKQKRAQSALDNETWVESETANTLNAFDVGDVRTTEAVVYCLQGGGTTSQNSQGMGHTIDTSYTINTIDRHAVVYQETVGSLCARNYKGVGSQYVDEGKLICAVDCRNATEDIVNGALQSNSAHSLNGNNVVRTRYIVRRLTPLECERLQGYPDGWTDIGEWVDSNGKTRQTSDAARYKALGNSIALPPWKWVLKKLCACYERDATMASLFDGIGGFPYLWEQLNGKGSCLWASEIEEFPMAVTKVRIGE